MFDKALREQRFFGFSGLAGLLLLGGGGDSAGGIQIAAAEFAGPVAAKVSRVVDGDTIDVTAFLWLDQSANIRVRINGVDAPELESRCAAEHEMATRARDYLARRLADAEVKLSAIAYDKYGGRVRADVRDQKGDIASALISAGLARSYHGGKRQPWCDAG